MAKVSLAKEQDEQQAIKEAEQNAGPFVTISRQYGCWGFSLGLLLLEILNDEVAPPASWQIYHKEILDRLASETDLDAETLERQRRTRPGILVDFLRTLGGSKLPSGYRVRSRMADLIRGLAVEGHAIFVGQGSAGATHDLPRGISIRLEAPEPWRVKQIAFREGIGETEARRHVREMEREREYMRKIYQARYPRQPAFHLTYDCSVFSLAQIAVHVVQAMKMKGCLS